MKGNINLAAQEGFLNFFDKGTENFSVAAVATGLDRNDFDGDTREFVLNKCLNRVGLNKCEFASAGAEPNGLSLTDDNRLRFPFEKAWSRGRAIQVQYSHPSIPELEIAEIP